MLQLSRDWKHVFAALLRYAMCSSDSPEERRSQNTTSQVFFSLFCPREATTKSGEKTYAFQQCVLSAQWGVKINGAVQEQAAEMGKT